MLSVISNSNESIESSVSLAGKLACLTRLVQFPGWERCLRLAFPPKTLQGPLREGLKVSYDSDLKILCDLSSYIEWSIFFLGQYGDPTARVIKALLQPGDCAVDVGANVGVYTLIMAKAVTESGSVAAFDANPEVFGRLVQNLKLNDFCDRTKAFSCALSSTPGQATLHLPAPQSWNRGTATLIRQSRPQGTGIEVPVDTLDRALCDWESCALIKIDTDGNDFAVLQGATSIIERHLPSLIFEFDPELWPEASLSSHELGLKFEKLGYRFYWIDQRWRRLTRMNSKLFRKGNILAVSPNRVLRPI